MKTDPAFVEYRGFKQGVAYAAAILIQFYDLPTAGLGLLEQAGLTMRDLKAAKTDSYDLRIIKKAMGSKAPKKKRKVK